MTKPTCSRPDCDRLVYARGICSAHYQRDYRRGKVTNPRKRRRPCAVDGCASDASVRGWCDKHYRRWKKHGDPLTTQLIVGDDAQRFWSKVDKDGPTPCPDLGRCWIFTGGLTHDGYGQFSIAGVMIYAHRYSYELTVGAIPGGREIDHLCRTRDCVRASHLEPVTTRENLLRGDTITAENAAKTHCKQGHEFSPVNTRIRRDGGRECRACGRISSQRRRDAERQ